MRMHDFFNTNSNSQNLGQSSSGRGTRTKRGPWAAPAGTPGAWAPGHPAFQIQGPLSAWFQSAGVLLALLDRLGQTDDGTRS